LRVKLKRIKTLTKKIIKRIKIKKKTIHHQFGLKAESKNNKNFVNWLRKKSIRISIILKTPIHNKKKLNI
jgi:hypothetical protein